MSVHPPGGPGPGGQCGEEECSAGRERLRRLAWLWQPGEVEEQRARRDQGRCHICHIQPGQEEVGGTCSKGGITRKLRL